MESIIDEILRREGSKYTNRPTDKGGPTKYGITLATLRIHRGRPVTAEDVKALTEAEAREIYHAIYIKPFEFVSNARLRRLLVDSAVQHGIDDPTRWLQELLGLKVDGILGPATRQAVALTADQDRLYRRVLARRIRYYGRLITNDHSQAEYAAGWMDRVTEFLEV